MDQFRYDPKVDTPEYVIVESIHANPWTLWHLRKFDGTWKLGGGCPPPLCWEEGRPWTGWDRTTRLTEHHVKESCCPKCVALMRGAK